MVEHDKLLDKSVWKQTQKMSLLQSYHEKG